MSDNGYNVFTENLKIVDYRVLILGIPETELEDLLTYFVSERGSISKSLYEDFLIANAVGNLNQFMAHVQSVSLIEDIDIVKIRQEISKLILGHNPKLNPDNIIINKNKVLKLKSDKDDKDLIILSKNSNWNQSYYDEDGRYDPNTTNGKNSLEKPDKSNKKGETKSINNLEFKNEQVWWARLNEYIKVKVFSDEDIEFILTQRYFHNVTSFNTYIVTNCITDVEAIYERIDGMGVNVSPSKVIGELFALCVSVNGSISYEKAKELQPEDVDDNTSNQSGTQKAYSKRNNKSKKNAKNKPSFKQVTKKELIRLEDNIKLSLIGQDDAVNSLAKAIKRASIGIKDPIKPIGSFLFAGKTGCGKTLASKVLADELIKIKKNRIVIDCSEYSADHEYSKLIGCFVPGSKVLMGTGGLKNIEDIEVGEEVITHKGRNKKVEYVHEYDQDGEMIKYTTVNSNIPVTTTKTHEIFAIKHAHCDKGDKRAYRICKPTCKQEYCVNPPYESYKPEWIPASELEKDDVLVYPIYKPTGEFPKVLDLADYTDCSSRYKYDNEFVWAQKHVKVPRFIEVNEDLVRLAGYYVSEGGTSGEARTINFTFHSKEHDYIIEVVKLIRRVFGKDVRIKVQDRVEEGNSYRIWVSSKIVCHFMSSLFGHNTYVKRLPEWFKDLPDTLVRNFLETAVFGDGCTVIPRRMDYSTVSPDLFSHMELLFRRLGYLSYNQLEYKPNPKHTDRYRIYISGTQIEKLNDEFNFNIDLKDMKSTNIQRKAWTDDDYVYLQIKEIEKVNYTGKVYDLAVKNDTSYIISTAVHNSPNGYIGHDNGGVLTNAVIASPFSVVVFDEIEKASTKVYDLLLQILDEGRLTDGKGVSVSFKDTIIIMTSNIGVKELDDVSKTIGFGDVAVLNEKKKGKALDSALKKKFKPEFLNRIDAILHFKDLTKKDYMKIIDIELYKLTENLKTNDTDYKDIALEFDDKVKKYIYKEGVDAKYGARPIKRTIEKSVSNLIAETLLEDSYDYNSIINVTLKNKKIALNIEEPKKANDSKLFMHTEG